MLLNLTFTSTLVGNPCQIEVDLECDPDGTDYEVIKATLVHLLPYVPQAHLFSEPNPPDFTAAPDLNTRLDPSETDILFSCEIEQAIPAAIREQEQCLADSIREDRP